MVDLLVRVESGYAKVVISPERRSPIRFLSPS